MSHRRYSTSAALAASTAVVAAVASIGITGCGNDRVTADARRTLGPQLGASQSTSVAAAPQQRQAASADDLIAARRYLEATIRLDPTNEGARAALAGLGGPADADLAVPNVTPLAGPVASRAPGARPSASFGEVAFGAVGAIGSDVATAVSPLANGLATVRVGAVRSDSARSITAMVVGRSSSDSAAGDSTRLMRTANQPSNSGHAAATRRRGEYELETAVAARADSADAAAQNSGDSIHATTARSTGTVTKAKHKRTWPWTRAQRWLVAKGIGAGGGAGVVIGAIVGNVPGALIAGSLTGGALGFHKATKIGPAAPYPSKADSVAFEENKRRHDGEKSKRVETDTTAKVAVAHP